MLFRYQERLHLSYDEVINTPWSEIERAHYVWSLDSSRDKLELKRQEAKSQSPS